MDEIRFRLPAGMDKLLEKISKELGIKPNDIAKIALQNFLKDIGAFSVKNKEPKNEKNGKEKNKK